MMDTHPAIAIYLERSAPSKVVKALGEHMAVRPAPGEAVAEHTPVQRRRAESGT